MASVLPITAFNPGAQHSRAKPVTDPDACVQHGFFGSWRPRHPCVNAL